MKIEQIFEVRKKTLKALIDEYGSTAEFCRIFEKDESRIRHLLNGQRTFGEKAARKLEEDCGLPDFYFDMGANDLMPLATSFMRLNARDQKEILRMMELLLRDHKKASS